MDSVLIAPADSCPDDTLPPEQKTGSDYVSAGKKLINSQHTELKAVTAVKHQTLSY